MKICSNCKTKKELSDFHIDRRAPTGRASACKICAKARSKRWYKDSENYRTIVRNSGLRHRFGISNEDYFELLKEQDGVCYICKTSPEEGKYLHVDHCHDSGNIRGLLCKNCNHGLGNFKDNPDFLTKAIEYLDRNSVSN